MQTLGDVIDLLMALIAAALILPAIWRAHGSKIKRALIGLGCLIVTPFMSRWEGWEADPDGTEPAHVPTLSADTGPDPDLLDITELPHISTHMTPREMAITILSQT